MSAAPGPIPRLPVFGWASLAGRREPPAATMLSMGPMHYTTSGRASILLGLEVLGIGAGARILLPTYHCPTMVAPAVARGATPFFYPIDAHGAPDLAWLNAQDLGGVRAMLVAHYFGLPQPMGIVRRWCDERGIGLIEDCAHALFGCSDERAIGAWGDIAIGSLTKFLPVPEGGCLVINTGGPPPSLSRPSVWHQLKAAVDIVEAGARHGRLRGLNSLVTLPLATLRGLRQGRQPARTLPRPAAAHDDCSIDLALAHRGLTSPARWAAERLPRERVVQARRQRYAELSARLSGHSGIRPLLPMLPADCAPYVMPLWVDQPDPGYAELRRLQMPVFRWDRLWPATPMLAGDHGAAWSHHVLQLACHQDLSDSDIDRLVSTLLQIYVPRPSPDAQHLPRALAENAAAARSVAVDAYNHPDLLPADVQRLFEQAEQVNVEFGLTWYRNLISNVFPDNSAVRFFVLRQDRLPVVVLPVVAEGRGRTRRTMALGNFYTSHYAPLLAPGVQASDLLPLITAVRDTWAGSSSMRFSPMDPGSYAYATLCDALQLAGLPTFKYFCFGNWYLPRADLGWRDYLTSRSAGLRSTIKRLGKKFESEGGHFEIVSRADRLPQGVAAFEQVFAASWKRPEPFPAFLPDLINVCAGRGWLRLGIGWFNGQPVAAQLWIVAGGRAEIYKVAYDEAFKRYSPGTLLTAHLLEHVIERDGVAEVDYLIGDDHYKQTWMTHRRERWGLVAYDPKTLRGLTGLTREVVGRWAKPWVAASLGRLAFMRSRLARRDGQAS